MKTYPTEDRSSAEYLESRSSSLNSADETTTPETSTTTTATPESGDQEALRILGEAMGDLLALIDEADCQKWKQSHG